MSDCAAGAPGLAQVAEALERSPLRLVRGHPTRNQLAAPHGKVELELAVDFLVDAWPAET